MARRLARPAGGWGAFSTTFTITSGGTPDTKTNWADLIAGASIARDVYNLTLNVTTVIGVNNTDTAMLVDIGLGNTGNAVDKIVVSNLPVGNWLQLTSIPLPLHVPAGTRIAFRMQSAVASDVFAGQVTAYYGPGPPDFCGFHEGTALEMDTGTSGPSYGDITDSSVWEQIIASTAADYRAFQVVPCGIPADTAYTAGLFTMDLGVGPGGSEQNIGTIHIETNGTEQVTPWTIPVFHYPLAAGSRLALRKNTTVDGTAGILAWR